MVYICSQQHYGAAHCRLLYISGKVSHMCVSYVINHDILLYSAKMFTLQLLIDKLFIDNNLLVHFHDNIHL